jgi:hypothetical protein
MNIPEYKKKVDKHVEKWIKRTIQKNDNYDMCEVSLILTNLIKKYQQYNFIPIKKTCDGLLVMLADKQMALLIHPNYELTDYCNLIDSYSSDAKEKYFQTKCEKLSEK